MRYADYAYAHINNADHQERDPGRSAAIDRRAEQAGFSNSADYLDNVMKRPDTRSFEGVNGRVNWVNAGERLTGWNHTNEPTESTVIPARTPKIADDRYEKYKEKEAERLGLQKDQIPEKGPIAQNDRPSVQVDSPGATVGSASKPRDQAEVLKAAQDKQRDTPDQKLTPEQRRAALQEASEAVAKDQAQQKKAWEAETDPKKKEQMALKAGIEQADFKRQTARENADLTAQEKGAQSPQTLKAKSEVRAADKAYNQGVADWHKRSVRDSSYEPFDKKWSNEAERAMARESKSKDPQEKKDAALERQFNTTAGHGMGHGM